MLWVLGLVWTTPTHLQHQNPWRWETAIHHVPHSILDLFVSSKVEGRIAIDADGWETHFLPPDTSPATIAEVKAALDKAMQIEIEAEKPGWYLWRGLMVVIPCFLLFFLEIIFRRLNRSIRNKKNRVLPQVDSSRISL
jgi:hypothetical protein